MKKKEKTLEDRFTFLLSGGEKRRLERLAARAAQSGTKRTLETDGRVWKLKRGRHASRSWWQRAGFTLFPAAGQQTARPSFMGLDLRSDLRKEAGSERKQAVIFKVTYEPLKFMLTHERIFRANHRGLQIT